MSWFIIVCIEQDLILYIFIFVVFGLKKEYCVTYCRLTVLALAQVTK